MELNKILIVRLSSIGDIILSTPLVRAVWKKYPSAIIDFAIKKEYALLMQHNPYINNLIIVDSEDMQESKQIVKKNKYDCIINIQKSSRATQLISHAGTSLVTTYSKEKWNRFFLINFKWNLYNQVKPVYKRYFEAVEELGVEDDNEGTEVFFTNQEDEKVNILLADSFSKSNLPLITLCPGAKFANKRWTKEGFIEVAKRIQDTHGANIVLLGGPGEEELCEEIKSKILTNVINLAGKLNLLESAALLKKSKLVVANDSGLMHLAQSQNTPVIAIYGPTVKEFGFYPLEKNSTVIETNLSCRPCTKMGLDKCPKGHHKCMKDISSDLVYDNMKKYLE